MGVNVGAGEQARGLAGAGAAGTTSGRTGRAWSSPVAWLVALVPGVLGLITGGYHSAGPSSGATRASRRRSARSVSQLLATMPHDDIVHGAYYLAVHAVETAAGSSAPTVLRAPSVVAMAVAAAFTALIARRLATIAGSPYPAVTGLTAGVLFALLPAVIRYAQEARSYAIVTMLAAITTYLLLKAIDDGGRWWIGYGVAAALTGLFNIFGLLILIAQGVTLLIAAPGLPRPSGLAGGGRRRAGPLGAGRDRRGGRPHPARGLRVRAAQRDLLDDRPCDHHSAGLNLARTWAGPQKLFWPVFGLAAFGVAADAVTWRRGRPLVTPGSVALPRGAAAVLLWRLRSTRSTTAGMWSTACPPSPSSRRGGSRGSPGWSRPRYRR